MGFRYSLSQVRIEIKNASGIEVASFGGNKSMLGSVTLSRATERFTAEGDATGGYIINETLDATGTVAISIRQFADLANTLTKVFNGYDSDAMYGVLSPGQGALTITVHYQEKLVGTANGCFLNIPEFAFEEEAGDRDFEFVAGEVFMEAVNGIGTIV